MELSRNFLERTVRSYTGYLAGIEHYLLQFTWIKDAKFRDTSFKEDIYIQSLIYWAITMCKAIKPRSRKMQR